MLLKIGRIKLHVRKENLNLLPLRKSEFQAPGGSKDQNTSLKLQSVQLNE